MKFEQLKVFTTVCHLNNHLAAAAKHLGVSQSAVSQTIAELEREYDIILFHRINKRLQLTYEGEEFLRESEIILQKADRVRNRMLQLSCHETTLNLGVNLMQSKLITERFLLPFLQAYPGIHVHIFECMSRELLRGLNEKTMDAVIVSQKADYDREYRNTFHAFPLSLQERLVFCTHPDNPLARNRSVTWEEISDEPLVFLRSSERSNIMNVRYFAERGLMPAASRCVNQISSVIASVRAGMASTVIDEAATLGIEGILAVPIQGSELRTMSLAVSKTRRLNDELGILIDFLRKTDFEYRKGEAHEAASD